MHKLNESIHQYIDSLDDQYFDDENIALRDRKNIKDNIKKDFKDVDKTHDEFIKLNHKKDGHATMKTKEFKKMHLDESLFAEVEAPARSDNDFWYMNKRGCLFDIMLDNIAGSETVYTRNEAAAGTKNEWIPQNVGIGIPNEDVSVTYGDDGEQPSIIVRVPNQALADKVVALADRYNKPSSVTPLKYYGDNKLQVTILIDEEDFEGDYIEDGIQVRPDNRGRRKAAQKVPALV